MASILLRVLPYSSQLRVLIANKPLIYTLKTALSVASIIVSGSYGSSSYSSTSSSFSCEDLSDTSVSYDASVSKR